MRRRPLALVWAPVIPVIRRPVAVPSSGGRSRPRPALSLPARVSVALPVAVVALAVMVRLVPVVVPFRVLPPLPAVSVAVRVPATAALARLVVGWLGGRRVFAGESTLSLELILDLLLDELLGMPLT
jgi:hypothetical protein